MKNQDWEIPPNLQPDPDDYSFDLERSLRAVVNLKTYVPPDAFTAGTLGTERAGSGVVIRESGLVATIGYLITEAETIWITSADGRAIPGHALAYDQESGFGLVQALGQLELPALEMGDSDRLKIGDQVVFAAGGGRHHSVETRVVGRQEFAGYWEYVLDDAIFTAPAHPFWGGGGLIGSDGKLMGIGSLILQQGDGKGRRLDMNMVVPIGLLTPIMKDLLSYGRVNRPARPWLGMYATESDDSLVVGGLADNGPAEQAGVRAGDRILAVGGDEISDLAGTVAAGLGIRQRRGGGSAAADARQDPGRADGAFRGSDHVPEVAEAALIGAIEPDARGRRRVSLTCQPMYGLVPADRLVPRLLDDAHKLLRRFISHRNVIDHAVPSPTPARLPWRVASRKDGAVRRRRTKRRKPCVVSYSPAVVIWS